MKHLWISLRMMLVVTFLTGGLYPALITGVGRGLFQRQASGSLVLRGDKIVGSELLAQRFADPKYFWPRPSAGDDGTNYATVASSASNKGPTAADLRTNVLSRLAEFRTSHSLATNAVVPPEMVLTSGSGLDPHISPESARFQIKRIVSARTAARISPDAVSQLVDAMIEPRTFGFLGEPRVNVLKLNLALDSLPAK
jgi:K+-transporting ATPase ATPase C chain